MPTSVGPNTFGEENLVFGYDLGDTVNSYKGEPVYNRHDYDKSVMSQTGFDNWSCYDGNYTASYHTWNIAQSKTLVNIPGPDGKYTNAMLYYNFDGGFYGPTDWGGVPAAICTTGNKITLQAWVKAADAVSIGKTVTPYMYFSLNAGGAEATATNYTLTADWQLVSHTHTMSANATNYNNILYFFTQNSGAVRMYLTKTAVLSGIGHAVQWLPGGQTRSATQGLIDLTGNSTIDLTNVSFDSNVQMTFDGTNDKIHGVSTPLSYLSSSAFEFVVTPESTGVRMMIGGYRHNEGYSSPTIGAVYIDTDNKFKASVITTAEVYRYAESTTTTSANRTYHVVFNKDTVTGVMQLYINGVGEGAQTFNAATYGQWSSAGSYIGSNNLDFGKSFNTNSGQGWSGDFLDGKIHSIKLYSRTLTASEVKANYNAIKGRFKI